MTSKALEAATKAAEDFEGIILDYLMVLKHRGYEDGEYWVDGGNSDGKTLCDLIGLEPGRHLNVKVNAAICRAVGVLARDMPETIIRAFADNLSEDAADVVGVEIYERDQRGFEVFPAYEKTGDQYRVYGRNLVACAIAKDLE